MASPHQERFPGVFQNVTPAPAAQPNPKIERLWIWLPKGMVRKPSEHPKHVRCLSCTACQQLGDPEAGMVQGLLWVPCPAVPPSRSKTQFLQRAQSVGSSGPSQRGISPLQLLLWVVSRENPRGFLAKMIFLPHCRPIKGGLCSLLGLFWKKSLLVLCRLDSGGLSQHQGSGSGAGMRRRSGDEDGGQTSSHGVAAVLG